MKLYIANGQYVGTQADAKRLDRAYIQVEVPTDKEGLMAYLNRDWRNALPFPLDSEPQTLPPEEDGLDLIAEPTPAPKVETGFKLQPMPTPWASTQKSLIEVEEFIQNADHIQLASVTSNAIFRMRELEKRL